jgi:hypothetical protein
MCLARKDFGTHRLPASRLVDSGGLRHQEHADSSSVEAHAVATSAMPPLVIHTWRRCGSSRPCPRPMGPDYYLRVLVADHTEYENFSMSKLTRLAAISRIVSHQTMRLVKE